MRKLSTGLLNRALSAVLAAVLSLGPALQGASLAVASPAAPVEVLAASPTPPADTTGAAPAVEPTPTPVRELVELRTETSKHFEMSDGSKQAVISQAPVHYKDDAGKWLEIDTDVQRSPLTDEYSVTSAPLKSRFGRQEDGRKPVALEGKGWKVGLDMLGAVEGAKIGLGNKVRYLGVAKDADLEYEAQAKGVKETIILHSKEAPSSYSFALDIDGLELREVRPGEWQLFKPGASQPELTVSGLMVFDSSTNEIDEPAYCRDAKMSLVKTPEGAVVNYEVPREWLEDPEREFPVMIDPSVTKSASADTFLSSQYPTTNYGSSTELKVGYYDGTTGHNRSLVKFDVSSIPSNAYVDSATYSAYQFHTYYTNTPKITYLGWVEKSWSEASTWSSLGCSVDNEGGLFTGISNQSPSGRNIWVNWGVTSIVQDWVDKSVTNNGFGMYQNEGDSSQMPECWRKFYSSEYGTSSLRPKLVVNYDTPTHEIANYVSSYRVGDKITVQVKIRTPYYSDMDEVRLLLNYGNGNPRRGYLRWSKSNATSG